MIANNLTNNNNIDNNIKILKYRYQQKLNLEEKKLVEHLEA